MCINLLVFVEFTIIFYLLLTQKFSNKVQIEKVSCVYQIFRSIRWILIFSVRLVFGMHISQSVFMPCYLYVPNRYSMLISPFSQSPIEKRAMTAKELEELAQNLDLIESEDEQS